MPNEYIIYEDSVHAQVFLVQAEDEAQAWKLYLEQQWDYVEEPDGAYRHKSVPHNNLDDVFGTYGIMSQSDGSYSDTHGAVFSSLEDVKSVYGIKEQSDETFTSRDRAYANLAEALRHVVGHHHLEIAPCYINPMAAFQIVFVSKDKWDYVELDTPEDLKSDIVTQHLWQAERYKTLGRLQDAIAELRKALGLTAIKRERLDIINKIAWLLKSLGHFAASAKYYREALEATTEFDNEALTRYRLAEVYEDMGQHSKAFWHYKRISLEDLDDEDAEKITERIAELGRANTATKTA